MPYYNLNYTPTVFTVDKKKHFRNISVKQFGIRSARHIVGSNLCSTCLQRLSADVIDDI